MYYKNLVHYERTLQKVVRENLQVEVEFTCVEARYFLGLMYETSDRDNQYCSGYDYMQFVKHCKDYDQFRELTGDIMLELSKHKIKTFSDVKKWTDKVLKTHGLSIKREAF